MPESEQGKTVFYREPYEQGAEIPAVTLAVAKENLYDPEGTQTVSTDEFFLE